MPTRQHHTPHDLSSSISIGQVYRHVANASRVRIVRTYSPDASWSGRPELDVVPTTGGTPVPYDADKFCRQFVLA